MREQEIIRWLRSRQDAAPGVVLGIGDDAAVLATPAGGRQVVTTDLIVEGTHFTAEDPPRDVGWKGLAVSVSDVAAMGCRVTSAFLSVGLRRNLGRDYVEGLLEGASALCREFDLPLAGGDTTESTFGTVLCSTVIGEPPAGRFPILRSGARPGDVAFVTGRLGGSRAGHHLRFLPRQAAALELAIRHPVGAMLDLSDGLSTDAAHIARESGVVIRLLADRLPLSAAALADTRPLDRALNDGEDFELFFTVRPEGAEGLEAAGLAGTEVTRIGEVHDGDPRVLLVRADGREERLREGGYEHLR